jgi:hypothetical protein
MEFCSYMFIKSLYSIHEDVKSIGFSRLKLFVQQEGHARPALRLKFDDFALGRWVAHRRAEHQKGILSVERIKVLEALHESWTWDAIK